MDYSKKELRNSSHVLLRRVQRQVDRQQIAPKVEEMYFNGKGKKSKLLGLEEEPTLSVVNKKTRLGLFENRKGNR